MTSLDAQPTHSLRYHWLALGCGAVTTLAPLLWAKCYSASLALSFATHWHVPGLVDQFGRRLWLFPLRRTGTFQLSLTSLGAQPTHSLRCHGQAAGRGAKLGRSWGAAGAGRARQHISEAWSICAGFLPWFESVVLGLRLACFHDFAEAARSEHFFLALCHESATVGSDVSLGHVEA